MILYPAIDLKDGRCVRLAEGRMEDATIFNEDPAAQATLFQTAGFEWLHVVDLDGAFAGEPKNAGAVMGILDRLHIPVQIGGGVRSIESVTFWLNAGASRVILGTAAVRDPALVRHAAREFPQQIAVALDTRDGKVAVAGWAEQTDVRRRYGPPVRGCRRCRADRDRHRARWVEDRRECRLSPARSPTQ